MGKQIKKNTVQSTEAVVAFCGINCGECKAYIATKKNDLNLKKALAEDWSKQFGFQMKPEDMTCVGCAVLEGPHVGYCAKCVIRQCGVGKAVENCVFCVEYPCSKLEFIHSRKPEAKERLEQIRAHVKKPSGSRRATA